MLQKKPGFFSQFSLPDMDAVRRMEERDEASRLKAESEGALRTKKHNRRRNNRKYKRSYGRAKR